MDGDLAAIVPMSDPRGATAMGGFGYILRAFAGDMVPMVAFLSVLLTTGNIFVATGIGSAAALVQIGWALTRHRPVGGPASASSRCWAARRCSRAIRASSWSTLWSKRCLLMGRHHCWPAPGGSARTTQTCSFAG
jgi:hypothetical protein